jgi:predicted transposase YbfD/YdcC
METFDACFSELPDPRAANTVHDLTEVLFIALSAILCGAEGCTDMADFGRAKEGLLRRVLRLEGGIPSHDTFSRVFRALDPVAFEAAFRRFMAAFVCSTPLTGVVAIDGKAVRGAFERGRKATPLHLVNVWAVEARLVLAQRTAPGRNEVVGALEVLELLSLEGCIVTADALHCHRAMAAAILERGADYALAVKGNQPSLRKDAARWVEEAERGESDRVEQEQPASHGRREWREAVVAPAADMARAHDFPGIEAVGRVTSQRRVDGEDTEVATRYFLLSRRLSARRLLEVVRQHWTIENQLHWVLDVVFDEDRARNRKDHGPENISILRKLALNLLRTHPDTASIRRKVKRAGWDDAFLLSIIGHMR